MVRYRKVTLLDSTDLHVWLYKEMVVSGEHLHESVEEDFSDGRVELKHSKESFGFRTLRTYLTVIVFDVVAEPVVN